MNTSIGAVMAYIIIFALLMFWMVYGMKEYRRHKKEQEEFNRKWNSEQESINDAERIARLKRRASVWGAATRVSDVRKTRSPVVSGKQVQRVYGSTSSSGLPTREASRDTDAADLLIAGAAGYALGAALAGGGSGGEDSAPVGGGGSFDGGGASSGWDNSSSSDSSSSSSSDSSSSSSSDSGGSSDSSGGSE